jgi:hypothetical protein
MGNSVRPKRRVVRSGINPVGVAADPGESDRHAAYRDFQTEPNGCNRQDRCRWLPECTLCCRRPDEWPWNVPGAAPQRRYCRPHERSNDSRCRRTHRPIPPFRKERPRVGAHTRIVQSAGQPKPRTPGKDQSDRIGSDVPAGHNQFDRTILFDLLFSHLKPLCHAGFEDSIEGIALGQL